MSDDAPAVPSASQALGVDTCDRLFEVLSNYRRRLALRHLREADGPVALEELATELAHRESGSEPPSLRREKWEDVTAALAHVHLPQMDDVDVVDYDETADEIAVGKNAELAWELLDALGGER